MAIQVLETFYTSRIYTDALPITLSFSSLSNTVQENDVILAICAHANTVDVNLGVATSGYTEVADLYGNDAYDINLSVSYKQMGATPDDSIAFSTNSINYTEAYSCIISHIRGVSPASPLDVTATTATSANNSVPDNPSITPVTAGTLIFAIGASSKYVTGVPTPPTGYTLNSFTSIAAASGNVGVALMAAIKYWASGADNPSAWSNITADSACAWAAVTLAFRDAGTASDYTFLGAGGAVVAGDGEVSAGLFFVGDGGAIAAGDAGYDYTSTIACYAAVFPEIDGGSAYGYVHIHGWANTLQEDNSKAIGGNGYILATATISPEICDCRSVGYIPIYGYVNGSQYIDVTVITGEVSRIVYGRVSSGDQIPLVFSLGAIPIVGNSINTDFGAGIESIGYIGIHGSVNVFQEVEVYCSGSTGAAVNSSIYFDRGTIVTGISDSESFIPIYFIR